MTTSDPTAATSFSYLIAGGSVPIENQSYVERRADRELYERVRAKEYCFVFNSRQMGKSSLLVRTIQKLRQDSVLCAIINPQARGTSLSEDKWYAGTIKRLIEDLHLTDRVDFSKWWKELDAQSISAVERFYELIDNIILDYIDQDVVIFVEEVDHLLSLKFDTDGFFALIRLLHEQRSNKPKYRRLTFVFVGVATPYDLIRGHQYSSFNIGYAVELNGFLLEEAKPLMAGLIGQVSDPAGVLKEVLDWTGGQPFLTQRLLGLIVKEPVKTLPTEVLVRQVVENQIIDQWESQDIHLKTVRDRILQSDEQKRGRLLGIYQQILLEGEIAADDSLEQMQLRLAGCVVKRNGQLKLYNPIYRLALNQLWVERELSALRPAFYAEAMKEWYENNKEKSSFLLWGKALANAEAWAAGKRLSDDDNEFLQKSRERDRQEQEQKLESEQKALKASEQANQILQIAEKKARRILAATIVSSIFVAFFASLWTETAMQKSETYRLFSTANTLYGENKGLKAVETLIEALDLSTKVTSFIQSINPEDIQKNTFLALKLLYSNREINHVTTDQKVTSLNFSPDGKMVISGAEKGEVRLSRLDSNKEEWKHLHGQKKIIGVFFHPDGQKIISGSEDGELRIWNRDGTIVRTWNAHRKGLKSMSLSLDGEMIVSGGNDNLVKIWNLLEDQPIQELHMHQNPVESVAFSPDRQRIISISTSSRTVPVVKLWNLSSQSTKTLQLDWDYFNGDNNSLTTRFSPDGKKIAVVDDNKAMIKLWHTDDLDNKKNEALKLETTNITSWAFLPESDKLLTSSSSGAIRIWSLSRNREKTLKPIKSLTVNKTVDELDFPTKLALSKDGKFVASASKKFAGVRIWSLNGYQSEKWKHLDRHDRPVTRAIYSPDGKILASASRDGKIVLRNMDRRHSVQKIWSVDKIITSLTFHPDGKILASGDGDGTITFWNLDGTKIRTWIGHQKNVTQVLFTPDGKTVVSSGYDGKIKLWGLDGVKTQDLSGHGKRKIMGIAVSPDGKTLASGGSDNIIRLWILEKGRLTPSSKLFSNDIGVISVAFSPDGKKLAYGSSFGKVKTWNPESGDVEEIGSHKKAVTTVAFSPDGKMLASGGYDNKVKLWSILKEKNFVDLAIHNETVSSIAFDSDGHKLLSADEGGIINVLSLNASNLLLGSCNLIEQYLQANKTKEANKICKKPEHR